MKDLTIYYHCSTHWDREWYIPFQGFRYLLVKMIDDLVEKLEKDKEFELFCMDGQTIVLEDYAEVAGERVERLKKLIQDGRIKVGPWYVMPDEFLVSGESIIRNLMLGDRISKKWGGKPWKYGYVNDIFGHIAQLPQIFSGFDIHGAYLGRGLGNDKKMSHFLWMSPDGTKCYAFLGYYGCFARDYVVNYYGTDEYEKRLKTFIDNEISKSEVPIVLVTHTSDHFLANENVPKIKADIQKKYPNAEILQISLEKMVEQVKQYENLLPVVNGELAKPCKNHDGGFDGNLVLISNCLSSYYTLKQNNDRCQNLLEKRMEPLTAVLQLDGKKPDTSFIKLAYKYLIQNQPHDSICGCSADQTHKDMIYRYDQVYTICDAVLSDLLNLNINDTVVEGNDYRLKYYHFSPYSEKKVIDADILLYNGFPKESNTFSYNDPKCNFEIYDSKGNILPYQINRIEYKKLKRLDGQRYTYCDVYNVSFEAELLPMGLNEFIIKPALNRPVYDSDLLSGDNFAENEFLRLEIEHNGELCITDKKTGTVYSGLNRFIDDGETGDGWWHMAPNNDIVINSFGTEAIVEKLSEGSAKVTFRIIKNMLLPKEYNEYTHMRSEERLSLSIVSEVTLKSGAKNVEIVTEIDNNIKDHRLRLKFPTGIKSDVYFSGQAFYCNERQTQIPTENKKYYEAELFEKNMNGIVGIRNSEKNGLAFVSAEGLHECAVHENGDIYVSLLRSFHNVFLHPDSVNCQLQQKLTYSYSMVLLEEETEYCDLLKVQNTLANMDTVSSQKLSSGVSMKEKSYFSINNKHIILSAFKIAEDGNGIIVRLFNSDGKNQSCNIKICDGLTGRFTNLNEEILSEAPLYNGDEINFKAWEIKTIKFN